MIEIDQARELLKAAVQTQGRDFRYCEYHIGCYYAPIEKTAEGITLAPDDNRRKTGCLIGTALTLAGETRHIGYPHRVSNMHMDFPGMMSNDTAEYFQVAQTSQDSSSTWGESYEAAEGWHLKRKQ